MGPVDAFVEVLAAFSFESMCISLKYFYWSFSSEYVTGISKCRDRVLILFWVMILIAGLLSTYRVIVGRDIEVLVMKWENDVIFLTVQNSAFNSASVESAAIIDCIFVVHDMMTPFRKLLFDCIKRRSGRIFPNAESLKYVM